jgi:hypothetical protein
MPAVAFIKRDRIPTVRRRLPARAGLRWRTMATIKQEDLIRSVADAYGLALAATLIAAALVLSIG